MSLKLTNMGKIINEKEKNTSTVANNKVVFAVNNKVTFPIELEGFNLSVYPTAKDMKTKTNENNDTVFKQVFSMIESASIRGLYDTKIQLRSNVSLQTITNVLKMLGYTIRDTCTNGTYMEFNVSWNKAL